MKNIYQWETLIENEIEYQVIYIKPAKLYGFVVGEPGEDLFRVAYPAYPSDEDISGWHIIVKKEPDSNSEKMEYQTAIFEKNDLKFNVI